MAGLIGKKIGMTQVFSDDGTVTPVTVIQAGPCLVLESHPDRGRVKLGYGEVKPEKLNKPQRGYFARVELPPRRHIRDFRLSGDDRFEVGQEIKADLFQAGDFVDVIGVSKGRGFSGGIKRWGFSRWPMSHGHPEHRRTGSIGQASTPGRVARGKRMPGRHGGKRVNAANLKVVAARPDDNLLLVKGAVPGPANSLVLVRFSRKKPRRQREAKKSES